MKGPTYDGELVFKLDGIDSAHIESPCCRAMDLHFIRRDGSLRIEVRRASWATGYWYSNGRSRFGAPDKQPAFLINGRYAQCCPWCGAKPTYIGQFKDRR